MGLTDLLEVISAHDHDKPSSNSKVQKRFSGRAGRQKAAKHLIICLQLVRKILFGRCLAALFFCRPQSYTKVLR